MSLVVVQLAIGGDHADERQSEVAASATDEHQRSGRLVGDVGAVGARPNDAAAPLVVADKRGLAEPVRLPR
jgi:hypothetical protein